MDEPLAVGVEPDPPKIEKAVFSTGGMAFTPSIVLCVLYLELLVSHSVCQREQHPTA